MNLIYKLNKYILSKWKNSSNRKDTLIGVFHINQFRMGKKQINKIFIQYSVQFFDNFKSFNKKWNKR